MSITEKTPVTIGIVIIVVGVAIAWGSLSANTSNLERRVTDIENVQKSYPTREEYNYLKESVTEIKQTLKEIAAELKRK